MAAALKKDELHPTSVEFMNKYFRADTDYEFLQSFKRMYDDIAALQSVAYDEMSNIQQTMLCLLRISEIESLNLETELPIILYLQDQRDFHNAYQHCVYAMQHCKLTRNEQTTDDYAARTKLRMLYECHIENLYYLEKYEQVIEQTKEFLQDTHSATLLNSSARIFHLSFFANVKLKRYQEAVLDITIAISMDCTNANLYNHRCYAYCEIGDFEKALQDANQCLLIDSEHQIGLNNRGSVYNDLQKYELAIIDLDKCLDLSNGNNANAFKHRAYSYYMLKQYDQAIEDVNKALQINKEYKDAKELKAKIWNDHYCSIESGIDAYGEKNSDMLLLTPLVRIITDYVVGDVRDD